MKIKELNLTFSPAFYVGNITLYCRVEYFTDKGKERVLNWQKIINEDDFECLFDRLMEEAGAKIKQLIKKEKKNGC